MSDIDLAIKMIMLFHEDDEIDKVDYDLRDGIVHINTYKTLPAPVREIDLKLCIGDI